MSKTLVQITFHGLEPSDALEALAQERVEKLEALYERLQKVRVVIDVPHRKGRGSVRTVKVEMIVPGDELVVSRETADDIGSDTLPALIRDVFQAAQRVLRDHVDLETGAAQRHRANG